VGRRFGFRCERFEYVPDGSSLAWGKAWSGPIRRGDMFSWLLPPKTEVPWVQLQVTSIVGASGLPVDELRHGQIGTVALQGTAPPDIETGALLAGEMDD
jgi:GTPase